MFLSGSDPATSTTLLTQFLVFYNFIYTDPGYGTLIWQLLLAGIFGGMFYFRRFKGFLSRRKRPDNGEQ
ncbi:MAG: hypothetical protein ND866_11150 [Pyrinomonadaceae bacterium]|nr:hypothetical protein [Pyrinomonadaceae bacterium]